MVGNQRHREVEIARHERIHDRRVVRGDVRQWYPAIVAQGHDLVDAQIDAVPRRKQEVVISKPDQQPVESFIRRHQTVAVFDGCRAIESRARGARFAR